MKIQTVNQLISVFKDISTRHYQINGFGIGDDWENGVEEKMHPVLWINPTEATMPESEAGYKTFEISFDVKVFDLVHKDESNENDVLSDCIDILKDIITEFKGHPYYQNSQMSLIDDINFEAFTEEFDEQVSGWECELTLMTPIINSFCGIPADDITGFEFPATDCPTVNVLCPSFIEDVVGIAPIIVTGGDTKTISIDNSVLIDTYVVDGSLTGNILTLERNEGQNDVDIDLSGLALTSTIMNGLTASGEITKLGGELTEDTNIISNGNQFTFTGTFNSNDQINFSNITPSVYVNDIGDVFNTYNTSTLHTSKQFVIRHNFGNVEIESLRGDLSLLSFAGVKLTSDIDKIEMGNMLVGVFPGSGDWADNFVIAHKDNYNTISTDYNLAINKSGSISINIPTGETMNFDYNNTATMTLVDNKLIYGSYGPIGDEDVSLQGDVLMTQNVAMNNLPTDNTSIGSNDIWNDNGSIRIGTTTPVSGVPPLDNGQIYVGDVNDEAQSVNMSGDVHIDITGVTTIQDDSVTYQKIQDVTQPSVLGNDVAGEVEEIPMVEMYIDDATIISYLENNSSWVSKEYTGINITGTFQGQKHFNIDYIYEAVDNNQWVRYSRV